MPLNHFSPESSTRLRGLGRRTALLATAFAAAALVTTGCAAPVAHDPATATHSSTSDQAAAPVTLTDGWAKASPKGMSAAFGTLTNTTGAPIVITGVRGDFGPMELHEMAMDAQGQMVMRKVAGGVTIPAHGKVSLAPGGHHVMFLALSRPLVAGDTIQLTLTTSTAVDISLQVPVREFSGANETYQSSK